MNATIYRRLFTSLAATALLSTPFFSTHTAISSASTREQGCRRIQFQPQGVSATVTGNLAPQNNDCYVLRAARGQNMSVSITSPRQNVLLSITGADGIPYKRIVDDRANWTGRLPVTQDYYLKAVATGGRSSYSMRITILPQAAKQLEVGTVKSLQTGDLMCYATVVDENKTEHNLGATFEICEQKNKFLNRKVRLSYSYQNVNDCESIEPCGKIRRELLITRMSVIQ
ncbi:MULTISPECIES: hypothetical protein [Aerosakkonema]|uniref:hypothetical protein n=1 Tax=Aerosakkonema TaxID=1246629 RepID=UPI0035B801BD